MNNQKLIFNQDVLQLLKISEEIYKRQNCKGISNIVAFGTITIMQDSPLHRYL